MSSDDQETKPKHGAEPALGSSSTMVMLFVASIAMALFCIVVSAYAILKILETTPFMGIPVDARGNRIPVQGYPQLVFGLVGVVFFSFLAVVLRNHRAEMRDTSNEKFHSRR